MNSSIESTRKTVYEFARAGTIEGWWWWAFLLASVVLVIAGCVKFYRRDTDELSRPVAITLIFLRLTTIAALLFFFFDLTRRTQREFVRPSEVVVLVDTSQSMSLAESGQIGAASRADRATELLGESPLLAKLADEHRVSVYGFGAAPEPTLLETRGEVSASDIEKQVDRQSVVEAETAVAEFSPIAVAGLIVLVLSVCLSVASFLIAAITPAAERGGSADRPKPVGWVLGATAVTLVVGILLCGASYSIHSSRSFASLIGFPVPDSSAADGEEDQAASDADETAEGEDLPVEDSIKVLDWNEAIAASAAQSRIGDAVANILATHDPTTLAGIVLISDGQNNGGSDVNAAMAAARRSEVSVYPVGLGSSQPPVNVRVVDLDAPKRVYPNDKFAVSTILQGTGGEDLKVTVELLDGLEPESEADGESSLPVEVVDSQEVTIPGDGTLSGVKFELEPKSVGRRQLAVRVLAPPQDQNEKDNARATRYEVVARKLRVMTIAGGPTREYRFVRNLLYREPSVELSTWLQTGQPGMSQDADELLSEFPTTAVELFEYDAIAMFDPDWTKFSPEALDLLDRWIAQQAGGLVIVGGPVYHPRWLRLRTDPRVSQIAGFFPVTFSSRGLMIGTGREGGETAWPLEFTPEARRAEFLWLTEEPASSFQAWENFSGVYDYVGVKSAKPVAKVYAYFSDPTTRIGDRLPVYLASQFYGAGRVYFQGSGEIWRLRRESVDYFDSYYTKLIRWVCEGRLLRDSNRGVLLVDNPRAMVGDTITVRAVLTDDQFEPLSVPQVTAKLLSPGGRIDDVRLTPIEGESRPGTYGGRFVVRESGNHELRLTLGDGLSEELLRQNVQVRLPTIELERPRRNDEELRELAGVTGGTYWPVESDLANDKIAGQVVETIRPQPQTTILPGTPDGDFALRRNATLLWLLASVLTMEWIVRRLHRLA
jgi:hypothetical protein